MKRTQSTALLCLVSTSLRLSLVLGAVGVYASVGSAASTSKDTYYVNDHLATTVATSDAAGEIAQIESDAFGTQAGAVAKDSRFTGKPYDADMGAYVFPFRNYRSDEARWMSADPSGFPDGVNGVAYAPAIFSEIDTLGLLSWSLSGRGELERLGITLPDMTTEVIKIYRLWTAYTTKGNAVKMYQLADSNTDSGVDFRFNCHGWTFTGGLFWIGDGDAAKIIADEYVEVTNPEFAKIASFGGSSHTGLVNTDGSISNKRGSLEGVFNQSVINVSSAYGGVKYYE